MKIPLSAVKVFNILALVLKIVPEEFILFVYNVPFKYSVFALHERLAEVIIGLLSFPIRILVEGKIVTPVPPLETLIKFEPIILLAIILDIFTPSP